jgi:hypothetical protein
MKTHIKQLLLAVLVTSMVYVACQHKNNVQPSTPGGNDTTTNTSDTALCFERDILPIFTSNCAMSGCHDATTRAEGYQFTSYQTIVAKKFVAGNANETELYKKITDSDPKDILPPPPNAALSSAQIAKIYDWIQRGAPNTTGCSSGCDTNKYTFAAAVQPILNQYCKGCHNANLASGNIKLDSHASAQVVAVSGALMGAIKHASGYTPMPQGGNKLSDCQIRIFEKWVADGAPNN